MSIQNKAIQMLPLTSAAILNASKHESNQIKALVLREIINSRAYLDIMSEKQLNKFDNDLISSLKFMELIS